MTRIASAALFVVLAAALAGCGEDDESSGATDPGGPGALEFTHTGGCAEAFFWATTADDEHAVVVSVDLRDRSASEPTELDVELPDPAAEVELWEGTGLTSLMCNDVVEGEVTEKTPVVEGTISVTVQPRSEEPGNLSDGKAVLNGLVTEDGTELPDLEIKTTWIGFYAG